MSAVEKLPVLRMPRPLHSIRPWPVTVPSTRATTPVVSGVSVSGCSPFGVKRELGHVEHRMAGAAAEIVVDRRQRHRRAARRMAERAGGVDPVVDQRQPEILAGERMEALGRLLVGDGDPAIERQSAAGQLPASATLADQQRYVGEIARQAVEAAARAARPEAAGEAGDVELVDRRSRRRAGPRGPTR